MTVRAPASLVAEGPWFEELRRGDVFDGAPAVTLTSGLAAAHQSVVGNRLRLALDRALSRAVTGRDPAFVSPALVWDVAIGQSTEVTHHVVANLFYRGLYFRRAPAVDDVLRTRTEVVALRQNTPRPDRPATGLAVLRITTTDQDDRTVLDFWRCAMLPLRDPAVQTGHRDDVGAIGAPVDDSAVADLARSWRLDAFRAALPRSAGRDLVPGDSWRVAGGDVVSSAPELARLTLNIARTHHDDAAGPAGRLVYGGHTIGIALSQAVRAIPELVTVVGWHGCDHVAPVREGDTLSSSVSVTDVVGVDDGRLVHLRSRVQARSTAGEAPRDVLDWRFLALLP
ncbi:MaoC family dehydratase [Geodermatophilus sp. URMC 64]